MNQNAQKQAAAEAALSFIEAGTIVGVGTGSTANYFIDALATRKEEIRGAVASSEASAERLRQHGIEVLDRKSTRLNSSHVAISYAVFCLKKKTKGNSHAEHHGHQLIREHRQQG